MTETNLTMRPIGDDVFIEKMRDELVRARSKFPDSVCCLAALMEEVGELANALLEQQYAAKAGLTGEFTYAQRRIVREAVQVAVMACRVATEGDRSLLAIAASEATFPANPRC